MAQMDTTGKKEMVCEKETALLQAVVGSALCKADKKHYTQLKVKVKQKG